MIEETLPSLRAGDIATLRAITATETSAKRLADMGFVRGARIEMIQPGTPCIVRIDGAFVGLGAAHQESILLRCA